MRLVALFFCLLLLAGSLPAAPVFDPQAATRAFLDRVPPAQKARSDAYFEAGYWLDLWNFLLSAAISVLLLEARWSARMRDAAARLTSRRPLQVFLYWLQYLAATSALALPLTVYSGFFREHHYGLSSMSFFEWLGDEAKGFALGAVFGGLMIVLLFAPRPAFAAHLVALGDCGLRGFPGGDDCRPARCSSHRCSIRTPGWPTRACVSRSCGWRAPTGSRSPMFTR